MFSVFNHPSTKSWFFTLNKRISTENLAQMAEKIQSTVSSGISKNSNRMDDAQMCSSGLQHQRASVSPPHGHRNSMMEID